MTVDVIRYGPNGVEIREPFQMDDPAIDDGAYCERCLADLAECKCRVEDATAVGLLRDVVSALRGLPYASPVPHAVVHAINRIEDYLLAYHPAE